MLDYDIEAPEYDATRGGEERAQAAADALRPLLPQGLRRCGNPATIVDVACGTAIVSTRLREAGRTIVGVDQSHGMLALARPRLDGRVTTGDATRLPLADASVDVVTIVWLLHFLDEATSAAVIGEAARVLRPGGRFITTVGKNAAYFVTPSDIAEFMAPEQRRHVPLPTDDPARVRQIGARHGLERSGETGFVGFGQGRTPGWWRHRISERFDWTRAAGPEVVADLSARLDALPDQDVARPDPVYTVHAFTKAG